jgi:hypothetical protein
LILPVTIDFDAPRGRITIDVATNIPESIILKDIFHTCWCKISQCGNSGRDGRIWKRSGPAAGFEECKISIEVISLNEGANATTDNDITNNEFLNF